MAQFAASARRCAPYSPAMSIPPALSHVLCASPGGKRCARAADATWVTWALAAALCLGSAPHAWAQPTTAAVPGAAGGSGLDGALEQQVRALALGSAADALASAASAASGAPRIELVLGQLDPRLRLAPCGQVEPYLPEGTRLWGKARIGLRCTLGAVKWNVYLPITVKAFHTGWIANAHLAAGSVLSAADLSAAEVDLADDASAALTRPEAAIGRVLARPIKAGQSLRQSHIKPRQWFGAGDLVTVVAQGSGFSVAGQAQALTSGIEGQPARVRTEAGRILTGQPVGERRMELAL